MTIEFKLSLLPNRLFWKCQKEQGTCFSIVCVCVCGGGGGGGCGGVCGWYSKLRESRRDFTEITTATRRIFFGAMKTAPMEVLCDWDQFHSLFTVRSFFPDAFLLLCFGVKMNDQQSKDDITSMLCDFIFIHR